MIDNKSSLAGRGIYMLAEAVRTRLTRLEEGEREPEKARR